MFKLVSLSLLASAVALSPASAQGNTKSSSDGASAPAEKKVCKRIIRSGTNAKPKVCLTKAEWKKVEDNQL